MAVATRELCGVGRAREGLFGDAIVNNNRIRE